MLINYKGEKRNFAVENPGRHPLNPVIKVDTIRYRRMEIACHLIVYNEKTNYLLCDVPVRGTA